MSAIPRSVLASFGIREISPAGVYFFSATGIIWLYLNALPESIESRMPDSGWFGIGLALTLLAPALYYMDWRDLRCHTTLGKALIYFNFPMSAITFLLGLVQLFPAPIQRRIDLNPYVTWVWYMVSFLGGLPLAFWWEDRCRERRGSLRGLGRNEGLKT